MAETKLASPIPDIEEKAEAESANAVSGSAEAESELLDALEKLKEVPKILREGILLTGGGVAILLQAATPGVAKEASQNSNLASQLLEGLQATITYMYCLASGTRDEKKAVLDMINRSRAPLKGSDNYAEDPDVRLWIAATFYATATDFYQRIYGKVDYRTAERVYREYTLLTTALRLPPETWPKDRQAFWTYWDEKVEKLETPPEARTAAKDLLHNTDLPGWIRALKPFTRVVTTEMLPPQIREGYGLESTKASRCFYRFTMGLAVAMYPGLPKFIRSHPQRCRLKEFRRHMSNTL
ncbi:hypothetical protein VTN00DRAFT_8186 [Thermoascus crustaceus]|uniref:uncharacterized protein n=1 Tax=Thermoascus crustaceus TaxID=5088 RepID=UPI003743366C